jgi:uncharacterized protein (TIGR02246 family)
MRKTGNGAGRRRLLIGTMLMLAAAEFVGASALETPRLVAGETSAATQAPTSRATDEAALRSLIATASEAWAKGDAQTLAGVWAEDGELIAGDGSYHVGRPRITEFLTRILGGPWKDSRFVADITSVRFVAPDLALLHLSSAFLKAGEWEPAPGNRAAQSMLAVREGNVWQVAVYHSTRIAPPKPPTAN